MQSLHGRKFRTGNPSESDPLVDEGQAQADKCGSSAAPVFEHHHGTYSFLAHLTKADEP